MPQDTDEDAPTTLEETFERLAEESDGAHIRLDDLLNAFSGRAYGPLVLVPAFFATIPPLGSLPGMSVGTGIIIALVLVQILLMRERPWLPRRLRRIEIPARSYRTALDKVRPALAFVDRLSHRRLTVLTVPPARQVVAAIALVAALALIPFALIPFAAGVPGLALCFIGIGLTLRDGTWLLLGTAVSVLAVLLGFWLL